MENKSKTKVMPKVFELILYDVGKDTKENMKKILKNTGLAFKVSGKFLVEISKKYFKGYVDPKYSEFSQGINILTLFPFFAAYSARYAGEIFKRTNDKFLSYLVYLTLCLLSGIVLLEIPSLTNKLKNYLEEKYKQAFQN